MKPGDKVRVTLEGEVWYTHNAFLGTTLVCVKFDIEPDRPQFYSQITVPSEYVEKI